MTKLITLIPVVAFVWNFFQSDTVPAIKEDATYFGAKYAIEVGYPDLSDFGVPVREGTRTIYACYIQYGDSVVYVIRDVSGDVMDLGNLVIRLDYQSNTSTGVTILDHAERYAILTTPIVHPLMQSRFDVRFDCAKRPDSGCDTVHITAKSTGVEYQAVLSRKTPNVKFESLFYPDVDRLPLRFVRTDISRSPHILDKIFYGKAAVDSVLSIYDYTGYSRITEEELNAFEMPISIEKLREMQQKRDKRE